MGRKQEEPIQSRGRRCAIYTRKSTEEGLDQEFNSLDAQREACAAYILSQRHEGWSLVPDHFDDGGYSGGNMDRPGLKQLLAEVAAGRVDVIVVYKVDRLTRALSDFAKIVDVLDEAGASFVSITQAFNTTTSMGRLTLNVLLSFAQFEREVIGERVRDKVAASKRKGMWMGGNVPFGYAVQNRKLIVQPTEAGLIRRIFQRYVELRSVPLLLDELRAQQVSTSRRDVRAPIARGGLYHILSNPIYRGQIVHRGQSYPGEHEAIISEELWQMVQQELSANQVARTTRCNASDPSLLAGMLTDGEGRRLVPSHARKRSLRYRYYVSVKTPENIQDAVRLPAAPVERAVRETVCSFLADETGLLDLAPSELPGDQTMAMLKAARQLRSTIYGPTPSARAKLLEIGLKARVTAVDVEASVELGGLMKQLGVAVDDDAGGRVPLLTARMQIEQKRGVRMVAGAADGQASATRDGHMIELLLRAREAYQQVMASQHRASHQSSNQSKYLVRLARLTFLAPDIVEAILEGRQPASLNARRLSRISDLPASWSDQRQLLGFA